ncbi:MAG: SBBP repeat-containing protein [Phycisphaerae bacterium]|nr:SBBP repeat-containing protein [Phycisphaerae bacterium]
MARFKRPQHTHLHKTLLSLESLEPRVMLDGALSLAGSELAMAMADPLVNDPMQNSAEASTISLPHLDMLEYVKMSQNTSGFTVSGVTVDSANNIFVAGYASNYSGTVDKGGFDKIIQSHSGDNDGFIAKFSQKGDGLWITYLGGSDDDRITDIDIDTGGNIWVTGSTNSYDDFPGYENAHFGGNFTAQFTGEGSLRWTNWNGLYEENDSGNEQYSLAINPSQIDLDVTGGPYAMAFIREYINNDSKSFLGIASIGTSGGIQEVSRFNYDLYDLPNSNLQKIEVVSQSKLLVIATNPEDYYSFDVEVLTPTGHTVTGTYNGYVMDTYLDAQGSFLVTGYYNDDAFVKKFDSSGGLIWNVDIAGSGGDQAYVVTADDDGTVYASGWSSSYEDFPFINAISQDPGYSFVFMTCISANGDIQWNTGLDDGQGNGIGSPRESGMVIDDDGAIVYPWINWYQDTWDQAFVLTRISMDDAGDLPKASLKTSCIHDDYALLSEINTAKYLDVQFADTKGTTVNGDEISLNGQGAENVTIKGKPKLIDKEEQIYRYTLDGDFSVGPVTVNFVSGSFTNDNGITNISSTENFNTIPDISPLQFSIGLDEFTWDDQEEEFACDQTVSIGLKPESGASFIPLVTITDGALSFDKNSIYADGLFASTITGSSVQLFEGDLEIKIGQSATYYLSDNEIIGSNDFVMAGLDFQLTSLAFATASQLNLQGSINLPTEFNSFQLSLTGNQYATLSQSGIGLTGGTISIADTEIKLPYFEMTAESMSVEYVAATSASVGVAAQTDSLRFRGKVTLPNVFNATADFTTDTFAGTDGYIEINANGEVQWYGKLSVSEIVIIPDLWEVKEASLEVRQTTGGGMMVQGDGTAVVPPGMEIICGLGFVDGEFNYIKLGVGDLNVPIGATGAFLQSITGNVNNIADPDATKIAFGGGLGFTAGPKVSINLPNWAGGDLEGSLAEFGLEGGFTVSDLTGTGTVKVIGSLAEGTAVSNLNWDKETLTAQCSIKALSNLVTITGTMNADKKMNINISGQGVVTLPSVIPIWGGRQIVGANSMLTYLNDDTYSNDFVAGWGRLSISVFGKTRLFTAGLKVNFDGSYSFLGGKTVARLQAGLDTAQSNPIATTQSAMNYATDNATYRVSETYDAQDDQEWMLINAQWDNSATGNILLTAPDGTVYDQTAIAKSDFIAIVPELSNDHNTVLFIDQPDNGSWILTVESDQPLENLAFDGYQDTALPEFAIDSIAVNSYSQTAAIDYSSDSDLSNYQIAFYYDTDSSNGDGILIGQEEGDGQYSWDTSTVAAGNYYVYGMIRDDSNIPVAVYYDQPIIIPETAATTSVLIGTGQAAKVSYTDADGTVVSVSVKGDSGTLQFAGENITTTGTKSVTVLGDNLFLQTITLEGTEAASLNLSAKGGSDNEATMGSILAGDIKSLSGKGMILAGNVDATGTISTMKWGDIDDNVSISSNTAGKGFSLKAGNIGDNVTFTIEDTIKSISANEYRSGEIDCVAINKLTIKQNSCDVDVYAVDGDITSVSAGGDITGELYASGSIKSVASKSGSLTGDIISFGSVGKISAPQIDGLFIYAQSVGSMATKGDILNMILMTTAGDVKSLKATGDINTVTSIEGALGTISTRGDLSGTIRVKDSIKSVAAANMTATLSAGQDISKVTLKGNMVDSCIMAGYDLGSDWQFSSDDLCPGGNIGSVSVSGLFASSYLLAGTLPEVPLTFDSPYDKPYYADFGSIGQVKFGDVNYDSHEVFGLFAATSIKPFKIGKDTATPQNNFNIQTGPN